MRGGLSELSMQEKSHSSPPTRSSLSSPTPLPAAWTGTLNGPQWSICNWPQRHEHRHAASLGLQMDEMNG